MARTCSRCGRSPMLSVLLSSSSSIGPMASGSPRSAQSENRRRADIEVRLVQAGDQKLGNVFVFLVEAAMAPIAASRSTKGFAGRGPIEQQRNHAFVAQVAESAEGGGAQDIVGRIGLYDRLQRFESIRRLEAGKSSNGDARTR